MIASQETETTFADQDKFATTRCHRCRAKLRVRHAAKSRKPAAYSEAEDDAGITVFFCRNCTVEMYHQAG